LNDDDVHGRLLGDLTSDVREVYRFSMSEVESLDMNINGTTFVLGGAPFSLPIPGRPNIENALAVIACARSFGISDDVIAQGLASVDQVPGRMQVLSGENFDAIVDFAHTPEALDALLRTCRELAPNRRLVVIFGCGGGRDKQKRPQMAAIAGDLADVVVVTSDNPRFEDPAAIIDEVCAGFTDATMAEWSVEADRATAIADAIARAQDGDVIIVAGKGHERYQEVAACRTEFDDAAHIRAAMEVSR